ncbi:TauD/TfdA family dioxygenase [Sphingomonas sp. BIUV-7]|uniref:TauD/TfdA family dioxygenase n=1 Tax=Sphingomonas natans TaxID=3063330 RepID=A0ABT8Y5L1_9SPHN|nr:TauD/TfdA family dioxygenase [Sphingomonas sp. BIUV-7]MDO6413292.1 TauD/TfdA family dioxygenase [Sphingomonas sp. BIUV-7]
MATIHLPRLGQPHVLVEAAGERSILDLDREAIIALYKDRGALLFRGFGADAAQFRDFAWGFCATSVFNESPGRQPIEPARNIHTVDGGVGAFSLHPELSREPWKPDIAFFACLSAPSRGGETVICDGVEMVRAMPAAVREGLAGRRLLYIKPTWPELLDYWLGTPEPSDAELTKTSADCPYSFHRVHGDIVRVFSRPALHRPMFTDAPAFGNFLLFARFNNGRPDFPVLDDGHPVPEAWLQAIRGTGEGIKVAVQWRPGDVLMLDNTRFMHGRNAILDPGERLIATFFGYVDFARPDPEEPAHARWRRPGFRPPLPPQLAR